MKSFLFKFWWLILLLVALPLPWLLPPLRPFRLSDIVLLTPPRHLTEKSVIALSGLHRGDNLLRLSLKKVHDRLLSSPWIEGVALAKAFPGRLVISLEEQEPVALIQWNGLHLVNREGKIFKKLEGRDPKNLPIITGLKKGKEQEVAGLVGIIRSFYEQELLRTVGLSEIHWDESKGVVLFTLRPVVKAILGKEEWDKRIDRLSGILPEVLNAKTKNLSIDLTYNKRVFLKGG
ncbi:MAG: FtsQ-type POTRA domain-containing protein [Deltaproteobacteria bacterium]|nr:FtsQ-type POTRA domain-containing protein [Deltaproteobacteria bacterium]